MSKGLKVFIAAAAALLASILIVSFMNGMWEGLLTVLVVECASIFILKVYDRFTPKGQRVIESAKAEGRMLTAVLTKKKYIVGSHERGDSKIHREDHYNCVYEYSVGEKKCRYRCTTYDRPSDTITLYYPEGRPDKAIATSTDMIGSYAALCYLPILLGVAVWGLLKLIIDAIIPFVSMIAERIG